MENALEEIAALTAALSRMEERVALVESTLDNMSVLSGMAFRHLAATAEDRAQESERWKGTCREMEAFYLQRIGDTLRKAGEIQADRDSIRSKQRETVKKYLESLRTLAAMRDKEEELRRACGAE